MNKLRFTKATIDELTVEDHKTRSTFYDDKVRGLLIMVAPRTKTFYVLRMTPWSTVNNCTGLRFD